MINNNFKNTDFRDVIIASKSGEAPIAKLAGSKDGNLSLLADLITDTSKDNLQKIVASIFLLIKRPDSNANKDTQNILLLKPKCLWLNLVTQNNSTVLQDCYKRQGDLIPAFASYSSLETLKASYLNQPQTVTSILTSQGITGLSGVTIDGLSNVFMYDVNEGNRIRATTAAIPSANIVQSSRWV